MKILIIGFLVLLGWSSLSTYVYVCKIKGLCYEVQPVAIGTVPNPAVSTIDTLSNSLVKKEAIMPKDLLIYFAFDKSDFKTSAEAQKYFEDSLSYMYQKTSANLSIIGYTDAVGSNEYNEALGLRRAKSVQTFFESKGMPAVKIIIGSKGEKEPADDNNTVEGRAKNRRTVITIKP
jgi:outer membrane protein OmpA-like peptidoglycan-associated protein